MGRLRKEKEKKKKEKKESDCSGLGHCGGVGLIPGLALPYALGVAKKKEKKKKRHRVAEWIQNKTHMYTLCKRLASDLNTHID